MVSSGLSLGFSTATGRSRHQERNRKKKLRKKSALKRRRELKSQVLKTPLPAEFNGENHYESSDSDEDEPESMPVFELKGPFERFKLIDDDADNTSTKPASHTDINLKARTAALLAEEAAANEARQRNSGFSDDSDSSGRSKRKIKETDSDSEHNLGSRKSESGVPIPEVLSKKKLKRLNRPSVASLKQMVSRPDVVEMWDVCARDPLLLIQLKACRNTVPVPRHWCAKRKYLQGKRGFEKPPFKLPEYIARTGIMEMRQTVQDKDSDKTLKTKMREKIRPKVGKVDIDYHKLHDAFFKYQTKPKLSIHGDLYYEGKEFEIKLKEKKPGNLSEDLRTALGLPSGSGAERYPPPWLIAMQRYGPPPSYPNLKIPGLNAPIPDGCAFGYHPGGWGKPPVDELGRPVYGDVFGNGGNIAGVPPPPPPPTSLDATDEQVGSTTFWGELESDEESEGDDDDEDMDTDEEMEGGETGTAVSLTDAEKMLATLPGASAARPELDVGGLVTPAGGLFTPSGVSSVGLGLETPQSTIELRKKTIEEAMEDSTGLVTPSAQLYRVLPECETGLQANALMGSTKLYDVTGVTGVTRGLEAEDPRERMLRKRTPGTESQQSLAGGLKSDGGSVVAGTPHEAPVQTTAKKYKEFKF
ncbi:splicing factor 3B subunit 2 [Paragonimus westermani]|uniref:Splicing factor 3B subunit 2 n=1 Tax=Paragonimus westermani TaxID=34504 RepID=A0A5J4NXN3_9TREM|nr:splicing factor 3B subunit 2 [Paragonimus westermani]